MNCNQARTMMSAYRELKNGNDHTAGLDEHLETCASCREVLAHYTQVGEQIRSSAPVVVPAQDSHARLMKALADEHLKVLQKSAPGKVATPEFLKLYLQERAAEAQVGDDNDIAAFSTAETGPLPIIHARRKRRLVQVRQFTVLGMAASILILLMMGGLVSLLMLAHTNPRSTAFTKTSASLSRPSEVDQKTYGITTPYATITSALPNGNFVYYTASFTVDNTTSWMLMQFDRTTQTSKPMLTTASSDPLIVLNVSNTWVVWLQYARPQLIVHGDIPGPNDYSHYAPDRAWNLYALSLLPAAQSTDARPASTLTPVVTATPLPSTSPASQMQPDPDVQTPILLVQDVFNSLTTPAWVSSPLQGTWLSGDMLLVTRVDHLGNSYLESYELGEADEHVEVTEIAKAETGHVLSWPTTDSTGMTMYWANEWTSTDGVLHSNVWKQQEVEAPIHAHGYPETRTSYVRSVLLDDGMSFQPQVVDNTLFFISTSEVVVTHQGTMQAPNGTPFPVSATDTTVAFTPRTDAALYPSPAVTLLHGTLFMIALDGLNIGDESMLGTVGQSTAFQAGSGYVVWQDTTGYRMYDVTRQVDVAIGDTLNGASLLVVNGNTTVWFTSSSAGNGRLTLMAYSWPA